MQKPQARAIIEAILLTSEEPVSVERLRALFPEESRHLVQDTLSALELEYAGEGRGIHLTRVAGGYQLRTNPAVGAFVRTFFEARPLRLSRAAMETLAIISYRQPVTRAEVEEVRGVSCSGVLSTLQEYGLVHVIGQLNDIGKPNLYGTTPRFLEFFGLESIGDLPTLQSSELEALIAVQEQATATEEPATGDAE